MAKDASPDAPENGTSTADPNPPGSRRLRLWNADLWLACLIACLAANAAWLGAPAAVRVLLGVPLILFVPGYSLVSLLFPGHSGLDAVERIGLSFGLSMALVAPLALTVSLLPWGIGPTSIVLALTVAIVLAALGAIYRRSRQRLSNRFVVELPIPTSLFTPLLRPTVYRIALAVVPVLTALVVILYVVAVSGGNLSPATKLVFLNIALMVFALSMTAVYVRLRHSWRANADRHPPSSTIVSVGCRAIIPGLVLLALTAIAVNAYGVYSAQHDPSRMTEFALLNSAGEASRYPRDLTVGAPATVRVVVKNEEGRIVTYRLAIVNGGRASGTIPDMTLEHGETRSELVEFTTTEPGDQIVIRFELRRVGIDPDEGPAYRTLELVVDSREPVATDLPSSDQAANRSTAWRSSSLGTPDAHG